MTTTDARHSVAIADMGNYQEVLRQMSPLREVDPGQNRAHMFGNPFKLAKDQVKSQKNNSFLLFFQQLLKSAIYCFIICVSLLIKMAKAFAH